MERRVLLNDPSSLNIHVFNLQMRSIEEERQANRKSTEENERRNEWVIKKFIWSDSLSWNFFFSVPRIDQRSKKFLQTKQNAPSKIFSASIENRKHTLYILISIHSIPNIAVVTRDVLWSNPVLCWVKPLELNWIELKTLLVPRMRTKKRNRIDV